MALRQLRGILWLGLIVLASGACCRTGRRFESYPEGVRLQPPRSAPSEESRPPNILFFITDDQRRSRFNFLPAGRTADGEPRNLTPTIDRLASEGVVLSSIYASSTVCTSSRFSVMTGRYASRSTTPGFVLQTETFGQANVLFNTFIEPDTPNLARTLRKAGYLTGGVGKNDMVRAREVAVPVDGDPRDTVVRAALLSRHRAQVEAYERVGFDYAASIYASNLGRGHPYELRHHNMDWIVKGALDFLDRVEESGKPFFLYVAPTLEHEPGGQGRKFLGDPLATPEGFLEQPLTVMPPRSSIDRRIREAGLPAVVSDALWLDDGIAAILARIEAMGQLGNTVVFFFNDHANDGGKGSLYQGGALSVSFVWGAGGSAGRTMDSLVSSVDFAPTILELCGVSDEAPSMDGRSFLSLLRGEDVEGRDSVFLEIGMTRAVIKDGWKYLAFRIPESKKHMPRAEREQLLPMGQRESSDPMAPFSHMGDRPGGRPIERRAMNNHPHYRDSDQLYDLAADSGELRNLVGVEKHRARLEELRSIMRRYLQDLPGGFGNLKY